MLVRIVAWLLSLWVDVHVALTGRETEEMSDLEIAVGMAIGWLLIWALFVVPVLAGVWVLL